MLYKRKTGYLKNIINKIHSGVGTVNHRHMCRKSSVQTINQSNQKVAFSGSEAAPPQRSCSQTFVSSSKHIGFREGTLNASGP